MKQKINIGLFEDQLLFREGLKAILSNWQEIEVVFESNDATNIVDKLKRCSVVPDVLLVDLSLPPFQKNRYSGMQVANLVRDAFPELKVIVLSSYCEEIFMVQAIEWGAHGYLLKNSEPQEVHDAIVSVSNRGSYINEKTLHALQNKLNWKGQKPLEMETYKTGAQLSNREKEVLALICEQYTTEEIAEKLFISVKTVNGHRNNLLQKTGSKNTAGLVVHALKNNLVQVS